VLSAIYGDHLITLELLEHTPQLELVESGVYPGAQSFI